LPDGVTIEYVADLDDGHVMVVTHPATDYTDADFHLFYGPSSNLIERPVIRYSRSGDSETFDFQVNGTEYHVDFAWVPEPDRGTLDEGNGKTVGFTQRRPVPTALPDFSFTCL
jgi:hypothetical protein